MLQCVVNGCPWFCIDEIHFSWTKKRAPPEHPAAMHHRDVLLNLGPFDLHLRVPLHISSGFLAGPWAFRLTPLNVLSSIHVWTFNFTTYTSGFPGRTLDFSTWTSEQLLSNRPWTSDFSYCISSGMDETHKNYQATYFPYSYIFTFVFHSTLLGERQIFCMCVQWVCRFTRQSLQNRSSACTESLSHPVYL